jgi:hypothetical protein
MSMKEISIWALSAAWAVLLLLPGVLLAGTATYQYDKLNRLVEVG